MWRIGNFEVDPRTFALRRERAAVEIQRRPLDLLLFLVERRDRIVSRAELLSHVWGGVAVSEGAVSTAVYELRDALGDLDRPASKRWIQTIRGRGFRYRGPEPERLEERRGRGGLPFVCRGATCAELVQAIRAGEQGRGSLQLIEGVAGIGKTRLVEEALADANPASVATAWCELGAPAYWLWSQWIEAWAREGIPSTVALASKGALTEQDDIRGHFARARAFEHVLAEAAQTRPRVLVAEDLHWADPPSLALLESVAPRLEGRGIVILATRRTDEASSAPTRLGALSSVHRHPLGPLSAPDIYSILQALHGRYPSADVVGFVLERSGGIPLYVIELATGLEDLDRVPSRPTASPTRLLDRKFEGLAPQTRRALAIAALCGERFDVMLVEDVARDALPADRAWILEAESEGILAPDPSLPTRFFFRHALLRDAAEAGLGAEEAAHWHLRIGEAIERRHPEAAGHVATTLARHFAAAARILPEPTRPLRHALVAAREAASLQVWPQVAVHCEHALGWIDALAPDAERDRLTLEAALLRCAAISGQEDYVQETQTLLARIEPELARAGGEQERALVAGFRYACARHFPRPDDLVRVADPVEDIDWLRPAVDCWKVVLASMAGQLATARQPAPAESDSVPLRGFRARAGWDPWSEQAGYSAFACFAAGQDAEAVARSERAIQIAEERGDVRGILWTRFLAMLLSDLRDDWPRMLAAAEPMETLGQTHGITPWLGAGFGFSIWANVRQANKKNDVGCERIGKIIRSRGNAPNSSPRTLVLLIASRVLAWASLKDLAREALKDALAIAAASQERFLLAELLRNRALLCEERDPKAREDWARAVEIALEQGAVVFELRARADRVAAGAETPDDPKRLAAIGRDLARSLAPVDRGRLDRALG
ncbi:MAG: AAA family ATPase [Deltaproteobacteria bacterium]|nr:AAA family ATPase [Deltaproteobacteria bacterium]